MSDLFVTVDSGSTRDIDDAFCLTRDSDGFLLQIAIANAASLVAEGSGVDLRARERAESIYSSTRVLTPMLPKAISEDRGSLTANVPRSAVVFRIGLSDALEVRSFDAAEQTIEVAARLTYEDIPRLAADTTSPLSWQIRAACDIGRALNRSRRSRGALVFFDATRHLLTDEDGVLQVYRSEADTVGHLLIQELMVLTNRLCAEYMLSHDIPTLYRNHAKRMGSPPASDVATSLTDWAEDEDAAALQARLALLSGAAVYGPHASGHYALALPAYVHITSPLRRYADLFNQRELLRHLRREASPNGEVEMQALADQLTTTIRQHQEERREHFRQVVLRKASAALDAGELERLDDSELVQALKLGQEGEPLPEILTGEIARRLEENLATDKLAFAVFGRLSPEQMVEPLGSAAAKWITSKPTVSLSVLSNLSANEVIEGLNIQARGQETSFSASATVKRVGGDVYKTTGKGSAKKQAEQEAAVRLILALHGLKEPERGAALKQMPPAAKPNAKGQLMEMCQKYRWPAPEFVVKASGPTNCPVFDCTAVLRARGNTLRTEANGATTKKEAEQAAAAKLLEALDVAPKIHPSSKVPRAKDDLVSANPIGQLQELMQTRGLPIPQYTFTQDNSKPPIFYCKVVFGHKQGVAAEASGASKQAAKNTAAENALRLPLP